jgi:REP element-mobilizing transposase RayT
MTPDSDPKRHHRRSIRLRGYDYRQPGAYFVTICTHQQELLFEDPRLRRVAETGWQRIPRFFPQAGLDAWVVMPNHIHGIIAIVDEHRRGEASQGTGSGPIAVEERRSGLASKGVAGDASPLQAARRPRGVAPGSLGAIVGNFKSVTARRINALRGTPGMPVWQRSYYEHVVRNEQALEATRLYIAANPDRWAWDRYNPAAAGPDEQAAELRRLLQTGD